MITEIFLVLLVSVSVIGIGLAVQNDVVITIEIAEPMYSSYTRTLKICDKYDYCFVIDLLVECQGDKVLNVTPLGHYIRVTPEYNKTGIVGWCSE